MSLTHDYTEIDASIFRRRTAQHRAAMVAEAQAAIQQRRERQRAGVEPLYSIVEDVLHAAGCVEVRCTFKHEGVVQVRAEGMAVPVSKTRLGFTRMLRDDEVCEIVQQAERALKAAGGWRTHVVWDRDPPVLYVAKVPVRLDLGL